VPHVIVVGAGGNIGSHLVRHLARNPRVKRLTLIDPDRYGPENLMGQDIVGTDVGEPKVIAQARGLRSINGDIAITPIHDSVEHVPLGKLRANLIVACLDSRKSRMVVNHAAWRLGVPWIDAGVNATGVLVRVQVFMPGAEGPCLECAWDQSDYDAVDQRYPCQLDSTPAATNAPSSLGALAAALQAIECEKVLAGNHDCALVGRDLMLDAQHHKHYVTAFRRNLECRMPDHSGWRIDRIVGSASGLTLADFGARAAESEAVRREFRCRVAGQAFVRSLRCPNCGASRETLQLERTLKQPPICNSCGHSVRPSGFDMADVIGFADVPAPVLNQPLGALGFESGDVLSVSASSWERHYVLVDPS
jgi:molybdopterin/thiamine biosynthesis adenylyltransferase